MTSLYSQASGPSIHPLPKLSVSIVLFNTPAEDVRHALDDLEAITVPLAVTVVDNSPTPALRKVVDAAGVTYIHSGNNCGFGTGHNRVLKEKLSQYAYHLVLNADVRIPPSTIETLIDYMDENPGVGMVMPKVLNQDGSEQLQARCLPTPLELVVRRLFGTNAPNWETRLDTHEPISMPFLCGCFMLLRGSVLAKSGVFDERFFLYMEDADLCRRIGDIADTVYYPAARIYHTRSRASYKNPRMLWTHLRSAIQYFNKWGWIWDHARSHRNRHAGKPVVSSPPSHPLRECRTDGLVRSKTYISQSLDDANEVRSREGHDEDGAYAGSV
jgi:GT2 family glycosyltransferase